MEEAGGARRAVTGGHVAVWRRQVQHGEQLLEDMLHCGGERWSAMISYSRTCHSVEKTGED